MLVLSEVYTWIKDRAGNKSDSNDNTRYSMELDLVSVIPASDYIRKNIPIESKKDNRDFWAAYVNVKNAI